MVWRSWAVRIAVLPEAGTELLRMKRNLSWNEDISPRNKQEFVQAFTLPSLPTSRHFFWEKAAFVAGVSVPHRARRARPLVTCPDLSKSLFEKAGRGVPAEPRASDFRERAAQPEASPYREIIFKTRSKPSLFHADFPSPQRRRGHRGLEKNPGGVCSHKTVTGFETVKPHLFSVFSAPLW